MTDVTQAGPALATGENLAFADDDQELMPAPYPEGALGDLMRQRDSARRNAAQAREQCERATATAAAQDALADGLQIAIEAMGGGKEISPVADTDPRGDAA